MVTERRESGENNSYYDFSLFDPTNLPQIESKQKTLRNAYKEIQLQPNKSLSNKKQKPALTIKNYTKS